MVQRWTIAQYHKSTEKDDFPQSQYVFELKIRRNYGNEQRVLIYDLSFRDQLQKRRIFMSDRVHRTYLEYQTILLRSLLPIQAIDLIWKWHIREVFFAWSIRKMLHVLGIYLSWLNSRIILNMIRLASTQQNSWRVHVVTVKDLLIV